jgi:hypothetical protein
VISIQATSWWPVLKVPSSYWSANPEQKAALDKVIEAAEPPDSDLEANIAAYRQANPT